MLQQSEPRTGLFGFGAMQQGIIAGIPRQSKLAQITDVQQQYSVQDVDESYRYEKIKNDIKRLEGNYEISDSIQIKTFIFNNPFLISILTEAPNQIKKVFGNKVNMSLEIHSDPEENNKELFVIIRSKFTPKKARQLIDRLDDEWFLDQLDNTQGYLCITEEPI